MDGLALPLFLLVSLGGFGGGCGLIVCSVTSQEAAFEPAFLLATFATGCVIIVYSVYSLASFEYGGSSQ